MRVLYIDIDSLRPDHLGCYGYLRNTTPNMDRIAGEGVRFENCYVSDAPCLPSRTALWSGRNGFHTGVVNHGGRRSTPFNEGTGRLFRDSFGLHGWMRRLRDLGYRCATVSSFGERHSAWHWYAGFHEILNPGKCGLETADEVTPYALEWLRRNGASDHWFLHLNFWDPHTPYNTPPSYPNPFDGAPLPPFYTEDMRQRCWAGFGPHSAREPYHYDDHPSYAQRGRGPERIDSMEAVKQWVDAYDTGIRYLDDHLGQIFSLLEEMGLLEETVIVIGADHGENLGELNVWGDHQTADHVTCRVPLILRWPGLTDEGRVDRSLIYHYDWAATLIELLGGQVPHQWDARSFAAAFREKRDEGRDYLVMSQCAWACQRAVRFDRFLFLRTYHDGYKELDPEMLFNVESDPHEERNLAAGRPVLVEHAKALLSDWYEANLLAGHPETDPMMTVLREGGPFHCRGHLRPYLDHLRCSGRSHHAQRLARLHPGEM